MIVNNLSYDPKTLRGMEIDVTFLAFPNEEEARKTEEADKYYSPSAFGEPVAHVTTPYPYEPISLEEAARYPILTHWYEEWEKRVDGEVTARLRRLLEIYANQ